MAMILGVTRSHYAMFEIGQRSLPTPASLLLNEMLAQFHAPESMARVQQRNAELDIGLLDYLENLLRENQFQLQVIARKLAAAQRKHEAASRRAMAMEFLKTRKFGMKASGAALARSSAEENISAKNVLSLELKKEALEIESRILMNRIKKIAMTQKIDFE